MKVLLINGSPKENGNTFRALTEVASTLNEEGIETEIVSIGKKAVQGCIACGMCGRIGKCTFNDELYYKIWRTVKDGIDGLVVGSPVYYGGPNGSLCALLDRVFYSLGPALQFKPGAGVVVCRRGGASAAFDRLNKRIAAVNQAEIFPVSLMPYLTILESFGMETLGDVQRFIEENSEEAYQLALSQLAVTDLDILSSSTALQYLCVVHALKTGGGRKDLKFIYDTINGKNDANEMLADMIMEHAESLAFMQNKKEEKKT